MAQGGFLDNEKILNTAFLGELSLDGTLRGVNGVLPLVSGLKDIGVKNVVVPLANSKEAALVEGIEVLGAEYLVDIVNHFSDNSECRLPELLISKAKSRQITPT